MSGYLLFINLFTIRIFENGSRCMEDILQTPSFNEYYLKIRSFR